MPTYKPSVIAMTGGTPSGFRDPADEESLGIEDGGTGAVTTKKARANLGVPIGYTVSGTANAIELARADGSEDAGLSNGMLVTFTPTETSDPANPVTIKINGHDVKDFDGQVVNGYPVIVRHSDTSFVTVVNIGDFFGKGESDARYLQRATGDANRAALGTPVVYTVTGTGNNIQLSRAGGSEDAELYNGMLVTFTPTETSDPANPVTIKINGHDVKDFDGQVMNNYPVIVKYDGTSFVTVVNTANFISAAAPADGRAALGVPIGYTVSGTANAIHLARADGSVDPELYEGMPIMFTPIVDSDDAVTITVQGNDEKPFDAQTSAGQGIVAYYNGTKFVAISGARTREITLCDTQTNVNNSSTSTYAACPMSVTITPNASRVRIEANYTFFSAQDTGSGRGFYVKLQRKVGAGTWEDVGNVFRVLVTFDNGSGTKSITNTQQVVAYDPSPSTSSTEYRYAFATYHGDASVVAKVGASYISAEGER